MLGSYDWNKNVLWICHKKLYQTYIHILYKIIKLIQRADIILDPRTLFVI